MYGWVEAFRSTQWESPPKAIHQTLSTLSAKSDALTSPIWDPTTNIEPSGALLYRHTGLCTGATSSAQWERLRAHSDGQVYQADRTDTRKNDIHSKKLG